MSPDSARRRTGTAGHPATPTRAGLALAVGLVVLIGLIVPAFASEADAPTVDADPAAAPAPTSTTSTVPPTTSTTVAEAVDVALASFSDEEIAALRLFFMSPEERDSFARFIAPPAPAPEPAPAPAAAPAPEPVPVEVPVEVAPVEVPAAPASVWDDLAYCETGGNWAHPPVGSYGYSGGLMFLPSTWNAYGGGEFASQAYLASRDAQIVVAERILASHGGTYRAWPGCRSKLGLP